MFYVLHLFCVCGLIFLFCFQVKFVKDIAEMSDLKPVLEKLASIAVAVLDTGCMR